MSEEVTVALELERDYRFDVDFGNERWPSLLMDEPEPLGAGDGPNASRVLAAAVGNCLSASLLFCLRKARIEVGGLRTTVTATMDRNERGRLRVAAMRVRIEPEVAPEDVPRMDRCLQLFEDFCVVTASVRGGIDVGVEVAPPGRPAGS